MILSADGGQWEENQPALILGTRGLAAIFIDVQGPDHDLHSGTYGGTIANPIHALVEILDSMHEKDGRITVDGFYDDVRQLTDKERGQIDQIPFDEAEYMGEVGTISTFGEPDFSTYERAWARPTLAGKWHIWWLPGRRFENRPAQHRTCQNFMPSGSRPESVQNCRYGPGTREQSGTPRCQGDSQKVRERGDPVFSSGI